LVVMDYIVFEEAGHKLTCSWHNGQQW
jgi:hypothetical protein